MPGISRKLEFTLFLSFYLALIDSLITLLRHPADLNRFGLILAPVAAATLFLFAVLTPLLLLIQVLTSRADDSTFQSAVIILLSILFPGLRLFNLIRLSSLTLHHIIMAGVILAAAGIITWKITRSGNPVVRGIRQALSGRFFQNLIILILIEAMLSVFLFQYTLGGASFLIIGLAVLLISGLIVLTLFIFYRLRPAIPTGWLAGGLLLVCAITGPILHKQTFIAHDRIQQVADYHAINRIILISIDTLRPDFLTCYNPQAEAPTHSMDALAADGILFENAYSAAPWTKPSVTSFMTGIPPVVHGVNNHQVRQPDSLVTLAEILASFGFRTAGIGKNTFLTDKQNYQQGFQTYDFFPKGDRDTGFGFGVKLYYQKISPRLFSLHANTEQLLDHTLEWIRENGQHPFFLWLHTHDPHFPLTPPAVYLTGKTPPERIKDSYPKLVQDMPSILKLTDPEERDWVRELYRAEVRYVDDNLGRLWQLLKERDLYDETLIIVTSDHGEELWEHDQFGHGHTLYNELIHVPLIIKLPLSIRPPESLRINEKVSQLSFFPTILEMCHIPLPAESYLYPSISGYWNEIPQQSSDILTSGTFAQGDRESLIRDQIKYIRNLESPFDEQLFDLNQDPGETHSTLETMPDMLETTRVELDSIKQRALSLGPDLGNMESVIHSPETLKKLRSLGYIK
jgi:arylsulfatase A-like enzyme